MSGGFIVNAVILISNNGGNNSFIVTIDGIQTNVNYFHLSDNYPIKNFTPSEAIEFQYNYTTNLKYYTNDVWAKVSLLVPPSNPNILIIDPGNKNILRYSVIVNTPWNSVAGTENYEDNLMFYSGGVLRLYNNNSSSYVSVTPEMSVTRVPVIDKSLPQWYYSTWYFVTIEFDIPYEYVSIDTPTFMGWCNEIPLFYIRPTGPWTAFPYYLVFNNSVYMEQDDNTNLILYQNKVVLDALSSMQNALINAMNNSGSSGSNAVVTAVNNNAQTVANEMKNTGNKIVQAVDEAANKIIEFDLGEVPDEIIEELAAQKEYMDEQEEQFKENFDKALEEYEKHTLDNIKNTPMYSSVISPIYQLIIDLPYVTPILAFVLVIIVVVIVLKR